jgi:molybdopterin-guanine dinucleotide biosynthesis protein A
VNIAAGILAGGDARRFGGIAKGLLRDRHGDTIVERLARGIRQTGLAEIALLTSDRDSYKSLGMPILADLRQGQGPLAAMETALSHFAGTHEAVLFAPCDLPGLSAAEIRRLVAAFQGGRAEAVAAEIETGEMQPLCAVLSAALLKNIAGFLDDGRRSVIEFLRESQAQAVSFENAEPFFNVNAPDDWRHWLAENVSH